MFVTRQPPCKPAIHNAETRKLIDQAADDGVLPLASMLDAIRFYKNEARELIEKLLAKGVAPPVDGEQAGDSGAIVEAIGQVVKLRELELQAASRAAPYCHPRMGNAAEEPGEDIVPLAERLAAYERRDYLAAQDDNVVELNPPK